jgi:hypothetical protein
MLTVERQREASKATPPSPSHEARVSHGDRVREEEIKEVVVEVEDVRESKGCRGRGRRRDGAGTVPAAEPNRPEAARVSHKGEQGKREGRKWGNDGGYQGASSPARSCGGSGRWQPE